MSAQYAVVFQPTLDLNVTAVGPYRSFERASAQCDVFHALAMNVGADHIIPQVVMFATPQEAHDEIVSMGDGQVEAENR